MSNTLERWSSAECTESGCYGNSMLEEREKRES